MFSLVSGIYDAYLAPTQLNLLVVGVNGVGKTALLERLKVTQFTKNKRASVTTTTRSHSKDSTHNNHDSSLLLFPPPVPESFLPLSVREKQKDSMNASFHQHSRHQVRTKRKKKKSKTKKSPPPQQHQHQQQQPEGTQKRRSFLSCPAPSRYSKAKEESSDEDEADDYSSNGDSDDENDTSGKPQDKNGIGQSSLHMSMEDVSLANDDSIANMNGTSTKDAPPAADNNANNNNNRNDGNGCNSDEEEDQQFDLKPKSRMLPLHKIRPTIGMNLAKVEICGAQCHVWDVGGKMHDLWSRYYQDCDAVIFVWKIVDDSDPLNNLAPDDGNDSDDSDQLPPVTAAEQLTILEQVRECIPDDVPFLIWGHWFPSPALPKNKQKNKLYSYDEAHSTAALLPHYHNPLMTVYFGSAKTGAGVRTAMEWLIPIAARQKKFRDKSPTVAEK